MTDVKVSVIIPVYNAEKHLEQCLNSVICQTLKETEIICVDDGSGDGSAEILKKYSSEDKRIRVITQENGGAGNARNNGMKNATGEYLAFLDSDDWFELTALEKLYTQAVRCDADICVCGRTDHLESCGKSISYQVLSSRNSYPEEQPFSIESNPDGILTFTNGVIWNKLFRRAFLEDNRLTFLETHRAEDFPFVTIALCLAKRIAVINEALINYRLFCADGLTATAYQNPGEIIDNWLLTADELKRRGVYPERSMANRVWGSLLWLIQQTDSVQYPKVYERIKNQVLPALGIRPQKNGYYFRPWHEELLDHLYREDAGEFLLSYLKVMEGRLREFRGSKQIQAEENRARVRSLQERIREKNEKISDQKARITEQNEKIAKHQRKIMEMKEKNTAQSARIKELNGEIKALKESGSYRIGRAVTWLPRKIKAFFSKQSF